MSITRDISTNKVKCSRCGDTFEIHFPLIAGRPIYCRRCVQLMKAVSVVQAKLLKEELSLEQNDGQIAQQINSLLIKESIEVSKENEDLLNSLVEKLVDDEKRRKKIVRQLRKLQNQKR